MMTTRLGSLAALLIPVALVALMTQSNYSEALAKMPTVTIGKNTVKLEVAQTEEEIQRGLMYRTALDKDSGMVFLFKPPRAVRFWMFHCFISLDMIFVKDGKIVAISENVPPCKSPNPGDCPTYPDKDVDVNEVIEVNAGYCKEHGIKEGDTVKFDF